MGTTVDRVFVEAVLRVCAEAATILGADPELRERIILQTKCGIRLAEGERPGFYDLRGKSIIRRVEE